MSEDMSPTEEEGEATAKPKGKRGLLVALLLALGLGGGAFYATFMGLVSVPFGNESNANSEKASMTDDAKALSFVAIEPLFISLGPNASHQLRFSAELEVVPEQASAVTMVMPRIKDALNSYLRAVDLAELRDPAALIRIRGQMLRRIKIVTGEDQVLDLLITEFVFI